MIDIDALKRDKRPQSSTIVHALIDRLEAAEKERDALRADKAILQQMMYSLKDRLEVAEKERDALRANIERMEKIESAAQNLVKMKGRHNTEIAYRRLVATLEESK